MKEKNPRDRSFIATITDFYQKYARDSLPWRHNLTPYTVLVSEVMLQQTQVERVKTKYLAWITTFPTLLDLGNADLAQVLVLWQGLGYQRRAKALLTIAKTIRELPKTYSELVLLPGVGTYTASALMAFAYNIFSHPVIETNIRTAVIEHYFPRKKLVTDKEIGDVLTRLSLQETVKHLGARDWYYALMDYGAHLKSKSISHNKRSAQYRSQSSFKGSKRELRAKALYAILNKEPMPKDDRLSDVLEELLKEGFLVKKKSGYQVV